MANLFLQLLLRASFIVILAYSLMTTDKLQLAMKQRQSKKSLVWLFIVFALFAIISNFMGVVVEGDQIVNTSNLWQLPAGASLANSRVLAISVSGMIGGTFLGFAVGLVTGIVRVLQGGLDPFIYFISSVSVGIISGLLGDRSIRQQRYLSVSEASLCATMMELLQMLIIYLFSQDAGQALQLIQLIIIPMVVVNSLGAGVFMSIIQLLIRQGVNTKAIQTSQVLSLANQTLPYFNQGLNRTSAQALVELIYPAVNAAAVSITNDHQVLAYIGAGSDHHFAGQDIRTDLTQTTLASGEKSIALNSDQIGCHQANCPIAAGIIVPLKNQNETLGTLKFYFYRPEDITALEEELASGLADIFSMQLTLGMIQAQKQLLEQAELKSLQAQVNPHFFFNALNTISAIMRFDVDKARHLLLNLSDYFRASLTNHQHPLISLAAEIQHVQAYLEIEEARFPGRVEVNFDVDPQCLSIELPNFTVQVLVENAMRHAFKHWQAEDGAKVWIKAQCKANYLLLRVQDNGRGIRPEILKEITHQPIESETGTGTALYNLNQRLVGIFDQSAALQIESSQGEGTCIETKIPIQGGQTS
ncbi:LytS/YhcK type 5TM receptor domain-containing protein [Ignavigranum ruoffiae]|uniref:LytS/YhcK type 5TM receptor domain-containing protein n=1 Tax=Ignavigranum ruoffiae TaxID=89093 RepID=UPI0024AE3814|nr:LytS/YhcK type 5TM receptor domain-containing protein [Ignavigranum ruoffiae]